MKLSIITINYNNKAGLQKTIDSVICQTWKDYEWIIIDGGSTDGSKELIEQYQQHFAYWCSEPDNGVYNAMNKGIVRAKGDYCLFLNSGDYLCSPDVLSIVFSEQRCEDIIYGNVITKGEKKETVLKSFHSDHILGVDMVKSTICHQAAFIKKDLFDKCGNYDESLTMVSDWKFFFVVILMHKCSVKYIDVNVVYYDLTGFSTNYPQKLEEEKIKVLKDMLPDFVVHDYLDNLHINEVMKYSLTRKIFAVLYRVVLFYEKKKGYVLE